MNRNVFGIWFGYILAFVAAGLGIFGIYLDIPKTYDPVFVIAVIGGFCIALVGIMGSAQEWFEKKAKELKNK